MENLADHLVRGPDFGKHWFSEICTYVPNKYVVKFVNSFERTSSITINDFKIQKFKFLNFYATMNAKIINCILFLVVNNEFYCPKIVKF